jgi:hypothetical protein
MPVQKFRGVEGLHADRLAERSEVLAYHFSKAEGWTKTLEYLCLRHDTHLAWLRTDPTPEPGDA